MPNNAITMRIHLVDKFVVSAHELHNVHYVKLCKMCNPWCDGVKSMAEHNKVPFSTREDAIEAGYTPCGSCNP